MEVSEPSKKTVIRRVSSPLDHGILLSYMCDPNYSWYAPTLTLKLGPFPTIVGTIVKLGRNSVIYITPDQITTSPLLKREVQEVPWIREQSRWRIQGLSSIAWSESRAWLSHRYDWYLNSCSGVRNTPILRLNGLDKVGCDDILGFYFRKGNRLVTRGFQKTHVNRCTGTAWKHRPQHAHWRDRWIPAK